MAVHQITVAKCTEEEVAQLQDFLRNLEEVIDENEPYDTDDADVTKSIADAACKLPKRAAWLVPLNLHILLDNYQDKESPHLAHAKWITDMLEVLKEADACFDYSARNRDAKSLNMMDAVHAKIKKILADGDTEPTR